MNILITGANGQLGSAIRSLASHTNRDFIFTDIGELDITQKAAVDAFFNKFPVNLCINCAAYTQVDKAESEPERARLINETAVGNLASACNAHNSTLIHLSTDFVFDGRNNRPYVEDDPASPLGVYGRTKLDGERAAASCRRHLIIRTSWLYAASGRNFVRTILDLAKKRDALRVVFDQTGTPTYADDLAGAILEITDELAEGRAIDEKINRIYHYSNEGVASWYDFAFEIIHLAGLKTELTPVRSSEYPTPAARPAYSVLDKAKIKKTFGLRIPHWKTSLEKCMEKII